METACELFEAKVSPVLSAHVGCGPLVVAVSGGADSTALLACLSRLRGRFGLELFCLHVDHGLRPEAERLGDRAAVEGLCAAYGIPCEILAIEPGRIAALAAESGRGIEDAARRLRHGALRASCERTGAAFAALGHTRDDALETALMRVLRGSGPAGLAFMPERRGRVLRPLIRTTRAEVLAYLDALGLAYRTDSTNADPAYLRNRVRRLLVPLLDECFPFWRSGLASGAAIQGRVADFLAAESAARLSWTGDPARGRLSLPRAAFFSAPQALREEAVFAGLDGIAAFEEPEHWSADAALSLREPRRATLSLFCAGGQKEASLGGWRLRLEDALVVLEADKGGDAAEGASFLVAEPGRYAFRGFEFAVGEAEEGRAVASVSVALPVLVRTALPADSVVGSDGRRRGASDLRAELRHAGVGAADCYCVQDGGGLRAVIAAARSADKVMRLRSHRKDGETDYARPLFFSIL